MVTSDPVGINGMSVEAGPDPVDPDEFPPGTDPASGVGDTKQGVATGASS